METGNVSSMLEMFYGCSSLTSLDVTKFDTGNVKYMANMFYGCKLLTELDVTGFVTDLVKTMNNMFYNCSGLETLDVTNFNTSNVTNMASMFCGCSSLTSLDVTNFVTSKVTNMASMFSGCRGLTELDIRNFETAKVGKMNAMFKNCFTLETLMFDVQKFNTSNVDDMSAMFQNCSVITSLNVTEFNTSKVKSMENMFSGCNSLTALDVTNFVTSNVTNMGGMFATCRGVTALNVSNFDTSNVTDMHSMFSSCSSLTALDVTNFETSNVTNMYSMFAGCSGLATLDVTKLNTSKVTDMHSMFLNSSSLTALDVTNFDTRKVTSMYLMFYNLPLLTSLTFGENFSTESIQPYQKTGESDSYKAYDGYPQTWQMFGGDNKLRYIDFYDSEDTDAFTSFERTDATNVFYRVPATTVIYLPHGSNGVTDATNVVYTGNDPMAGGGSHGGGAQILKCPNYYSEDKVDIEFPRDFRTNKAEYSRTMSTNYGSVVLPYAFKTNADIQAYTLDEEHTETMYFVDAETIPAHTPFAFKKLGSAKFINEDTTGRFGITVKATATTSAAEGGTPYTSDEHLSGWTTKGYYVNETVEDYDGTFYIAGDKFYKADGALTMYPHRVTFHGAWETEPTTETPARFFEIATVSKPEEEKTEEVDLETDDRELVDAIEAAELRKEMREAVAIYDEQGRMQNELKKGLNIIRMKNGSVKKAFIR